MRQELEQRLAEEKDASHERFMQLTHANDEIGDLRRELEQRKLLIASAMPHAML